MPIPAIPSPAVMYKASKIQGFEIELKMITERGTTNNKSIDKDFSTRKVFPYLLTLLFLKYSETRFFTVAEKSALEGREKVKFLIKNNLNKH